MDVGERATKLGLGGAKPGPSKECPLSFPGELVKELSRERAGERSGSERSFRAGEP